ncbi:glycoside hydrolase family 32 protein [Tepidibacillus infernus]|uniref:glycoside hydrolase family 32 protein n=1 Tax=Tepidibacillus infernus TaxID=1806172 RepID=UPI003B72F0ED
MALIHENIFTENSDYIYATLVTGNIKYNAEDRSANQCLVIMDKDGTIRKYENNPVIKGIPEGYTGHVRDPKVFKKNERYYMLLGAQRKDLTGTIIVFESVNALDWTFKGELDVQLEMQEFGYMWECPDYFELNGKDILVFSPQGIKPQGNDYKNVYNVVYTVGELDIDHLTYKVAHLQKLEKGFDFYAPQSFLDENQKRLLIAWAGSGEISYPTDEESWAHCLTIPRELVLKGNKLYQKPAEQLKTLRTTSISGKGVLQDQTLDIKNQTDVYELEINFKEIEASQFGIELCHSEKEGLILQFDRENEVVNLNREKFEYAFGGEFGFVRSEALQIDKEMKELFVDRSIVEIFINDGEVVFTTRVFPLKESRGIKLFANQKLAYHYTKYQLSNGIEV